MKKQNLISEKELSRRKIILYAIVDYYGEEQPQELLDKLYKAILYNKTEGLDSEEKAIVKTIKINIADNTYRASLLREPPVLAVAQPSH